MTERQPAIGASAERVVILALWGIAVLTCLLGATLDLPGGTREGAGAQLADLMRVAGTATLVVVLLLGPGLAWRAWSGRKWAFGFLPLPGLGALVCAGFLTWLLAKPIGAHFASFLALVPLLTLLPFAVLRAGRTGILEPGERRALLAIACMLGLAIGKALWSVGPDGELLAGTVSRTLEVGSRPDSRIPFHVVQMVANGTAPYSELGVSYLSPYNFSSRGPLSGIASAPIVLLAGGRPPTSMPDQPWTPFDPEGFMAFRLATMAFAATALMSLWSLVRRLAGEGAAQLSVLLAATTPFLVHEVWFTWPKMLAASFVLLAAFCLIGGRPFSAGLLVGIGYLMHPIALLSMPALCLIALWPVAGANWRRPQVKSVLMLLVGVGIFFALWRVANSGHYLQDEFLRYFNEAGAQVHAPVWSDPGAWFSHRLESLGNTVVPMMLALAHGDHPSINVFGSTSPAVIHVFFQYWNTLPFGIAIVFFPLLLVSLWRAGRLWPWPVFATVLVPFLAFAVYWGSYETGMLPEGLQTWVLTLVAMVAIQQAQAGFPWLRSAPLRAILSLRAVEVMAMALVPALATRSLLVSEQFELVDTFALLAITGFGAALIALVWSRYGVDDEVDTAPRSATEAKASRVAVAARTARAE